jgi:DNA replication and repair protein RecF
MKVTRLDIRNLRSLRDASIAPDPGLNLITGENGAGKSSVLEALHLMAYGRSFRGRVRDGIVRSGSEALEIFVEWVEADGARVRKAGLRHSGQAWRGRLDGQAVAHLGELCAALMVVTVEPGSHSLISGGGETRRRFLDWGLFHVEHGFLAVWRHYARALKQRNALLKSGARDNQLDAWDHELAVSGEQLHQHRLLYLTRLQVEVEALAASLTPRLGRPGIDLQPGWRQAELSLADALIVSRDRDRQVGHTTVGPHRADWRLHYATMPNREPLSRGQGKLAALTCLMAQARDCAAVRGEWPVIALDDLASELDRNHQQLVLDALQETGAQLLITGTEVSDEIGKRKVTMFHVEHGDIRTA